MMTRPFQRLKREKKIMMSPAVLKKISLLLFPSIRKELKLISAKTGNVPKANISMVSAPFMKLPVVKL